MSQKDENAILKQYADEGIIKLQFKIGQDVFTVNKYTECVEARRIEAIRVELHYIIKYNSLVYYARRLSDGNIYGFMDEELFATREEAEKRLKELQNE